MPFSQTMRLRVLLGAAVSILMLVLGTVLPGAASANTHKRHRAHIASACAFADTPAVAASRSDIKTAVVCLLNQERRDRGLPALREDPRLDRSAQEWTNTMVHDDAFSHGSNFSARISAAGFHWSTAGENIATGFATPRSVVRAWMQSAGHCRNILAPSFSAVGTGVVAKHINQYSGRNSSTWTQDFALPMGAHAPSGNWGPADGCPYAS